ncbi:hypothetical protein BLFGPEAP_02099 [Candidatus Methanoperedenaceae archaeon GB50]|nr:hypothetical protein BLFGPEAP_02099 [Candidatus Methanoperedenaceae archaeon GB50]
METKKTKRIHAVNPDTGQIMKTIKMEIPKEKVFKSFEGITWDGKHLWTAFFAGFFEFLQPDRYQRAAELLEVSLLTVILEGLPQMEDTYGVFVIMGKKLPSKIDRRKILEKEHEMLRSRVFIKDIKGMNPIGLVYDGQYLWYADRKLKRVFRVISGGIEEK